MAPEKRMNRAGMAALGVTALIIAAGAYLFLQFGERTNSGGASQANAQGSPVRPSAAAGREAPSLNLSDSQLAVVKVEPVTEHEFPTEKESVGGIDFNEDMTLQVFTPYQGRIIGLFAKVGDDVKKGQTLYTIDSPDLLNAVSSLIAAAGVLEMTTRNLARLKQLYTTRAVSQKDLEQTVSDQQTSEGNLRAGRDAVRLFGKTDAEIDTIIAKRLADPTLVVPSPITGRITARNAAPGLFVQPGNAPAPYSVADISTMWMLANVAESDSPAFRLGQAVKVRVTAFPDRQFDGKITTIGATVSEHAPRLDPLRGRRPAARIAIGHVRDICYSDR
jgi:membrane fusion protein, heavy metal efflux system